MQAIPFAHEVSVAIRAAREAGATALQMQGGIEAVKKADGSLVTPGDLAADAIVRQHLTLNFPADAILSEEEADSGERLSNRRLWIIDPIDGTKDYVAGTGEWAVQVALAVDGTLAVGVLDLPAEGVCLVGVPGHGAWVLDAQGQRPLAIDPANGDVLITSLSKRNRDAVAKVAAALPEFRSLHATSVGVKIWRMISGRAGLYVHPRPLAEWDAAAPAAVLLAAGGNVTDLAGAGLRFNSPLGRCPGLVYSKRADHAALIARMAAAGVELMP
ncbi:MAG TPA: 3'(2'),5'-bisphosphate nucleotidase CysQ [Planctomycetota bacterium]|nr:3'(2'),5'-bisphosphate nucleotidase CysQ [Planctomycetota bacterium]